MVTSPAMTKLGKHVCMDGRLYSKIADAETEDAQPFSLYWVLERSTLKKDANLVEAPCKVAFDVSVQPPSGSKRTFGFMSEDSDSLDIPCLTNEAPIKKGTKLVALDNGTISKILAKQEKAKAQAKK